MDNSSFRTYQAIVYPAQCDAMGHMTVQYYVAAFDQAMWNLVYTLGWRPEGTPAKTGFADVRHVIEYRSELKAGTPFAVDSVLLRAGKSSIVTVHRLVNLSSSALAAEMEMTSVHFDLIERTSLNLPHSLGLAERAGKWPDPMSGEH